MSNGYFVHATYEGKLDKKTEDRITEALQRRGAFDTFRTFTAATDDGQEFPCTYCDVDWGGWEEEDGSEGTDIEVFLKDLERAHYLASELRFCGMTVSVDQESRS